MSYIRTEQGRKRFDRIIKLLKEALKEAEIPPQDFGKYIVEKVTEDIRVHSLKDPIVEEIDSLQAKHHLRTAFLLEMNYIGFKLTEI